MPVSAIAGSALSGASAAASGAAKAGSSLFADLFQRAKGARSSSLNSATTETNVGELARDAQNQLSEFKQEMQKLFASAGIDTSWEIHLKSNGRGGLQVNADHPDCDKVEQLLQQNPELLEKFNALKATHDRLRAKGGEATLNDPRAPAFAVVYSDAEAHVEFE